MFLLAIYMALGLMALGAVGKMAMGKLVVHAPGGFEIEAQGDGGTLADLTAMAVTFGGACGMSYLILTGLTGGGGGAPAPTVPPSSVAIYFATDWANGSCDGANKNTNVCISNNSQWVVTGGNQPPHDSVMIVLPADSPTVSPWNTARPGTAGKVTRYDSHGTSNGGIQGKVLVDSSALKTHFGRIFILLEDSVQVSNHPISYKHQTTGGFQGVPIAWQFDTNVDIIVDSMGVTHGADGVAGGYSTHAPGTVTQDKRVHVDVWHCVQWERRIYANAGDPRITHRVYWMKRSGSSWSALDTVAHINNMRTNVFPWNETIAQRLAGPDSLDYSTTQDTTLMKWMQIAQEGAAGTNPVAGAYRGFWLAEFAISYEGHIPCDQTTTSVGTTTS